MLLADGNGPMVDEIEATATPIASPTVATQSATLVSPTPTPQPQGWLTRTNIFWGIVIILVLAVVGNWLYKKFWAKK